MKKILALLIAVLCGIATSHSATKLVFIAGASSHGPGLHEHRAGSMLLASQMEKSGLGFETVVVSNGWPEDESIFEGAAAVIIYSDGGENHPAFGHLDTLKELTKSGIGIGCIHYAVEIPAGIPGETLLGAVGGYFEADWSVNPHWTGNFTMIDHPISHGVKDFSILDEWYYHMRFQKNMDGVTPILTDLPGAETLSRPDGPHSGNPAVRKAVLEEKTPQPVMWIYERPADLGGGRGFGFTGGHFHKNWQQDDFRRIVLNAIAWIAKTEIPADGVQSVTPTDEEMDANLDKK